MYKLKNKQKELVVEAITGEGARNLAVQYLWMVGSIKEITPSIAKAVDSFLSELRANLCEVGLD
jgi:hypothetical protein